MVKVVLGTPSVEGSYKVKLSTVQLTDDSTDQGNRLFIVEPLGEMMLTPEMTGL